LRIALVFESVGGGTLDWSGVPAGLARGLTALGHEPVPIAADLPYALRRATDLLALAGHRRRGLGAMTPAAVAWRSRGTRRALTGIDAAILMGTTFEIPRRVPYVTYDDMTVPQLARLRDLPRRIAAPWSARQARALRDAAACGVVSEWAASSLVEDYGITRDRIAVVGVGANVHGPVPPRDWSVPRYLFVGFDWERKGGAAVLAAFREVRARLPEATLELICPPRGLAEPGVTERGTLDMRTEAGREALLDAYRVSTCFVMPSRFEPFAIAHTEAGLAGLPAIGTTVGGARDAVGAGGLTVAPGDHPALVAAMLELADPATARAVGARAAEHARPFTWETVARRLADRLVPEAAGRT